jgi:hypothetical protein
VDRIQVRIALEAEEGVPEVAEVVPERVHTGEPLRQPSGQQIDGEWKSMKR